MPAADRVGPAPSTLTYTVLALIFTFLWAASFVAVKVALRDCPPFFMMASRFLIAGPLLLLYGRTRGQVLPGTPGDWGRLAVLGWLYFALYLGLVALALRHMSAGTGAVLASTNPLILAIAAAWLLRERLTILKVTGMLLSFAGVLAIMRSRMGDQDQPGSMALMMLAIACHVTGTILFKRWRLGGNLLVVNAVQLLAAGVALILPSVLWEPLSTVRLTASFLLAIAFLIFAQSCGGNVIWLWLLSHGDTARASSWFFLNPVLGLFLGALVLREPLFPGDFIGSAAVALGIYLVQRA